MKRREFFKNAGLMAAGIAISPELMAKGMVPSEVAEEGSAPGDLNSMFPPKPLKADVNRTVSVVIIGIGNRGSVYARYAKKFPQVMKVAGIVDNNVRRLERYGKEYDIPQKYLFRSLDDFYAAGRRSPRLFHV